MSKHTQPHDAARALVAQAYKLWLQRETRTDDISAVVLFFDWPQAEGAASSEEQPTSSEAAPETPVGKADTASTSTTATASA